jgi:TATA-box binding protein (TBP) (component of TFIID and TFIIIB)
VDEIFCLHGKYLAYVARIFLKTFVLFTKILFTCLLLTTQAHIVVVLLKEGGKVVIHGGKFSTYKKHAFVFTPKKMKITMTKK